MIGILLYLKTIEQSVVSSTYLPIIAIILVLWKNNGKILLPKDSLLLFIFLFACMLNRSLHGFIPIAYTPVMSMRLFPYQLSFIASIIIGTRLTKKDLRIFLYCVLLEIIVGILEYAAGQASFLKPELRLGSLMLYSRRVYGISVNSSVLAQKIVLALVCWIVSLYSEKNIRNVWKYFFIALLACGLYITFNRSAIVSAALMWGFWLFYQTLHKNREKGFLFIRKVTIIIVCFAGILFSEKILFQFLRGQEEFQLEGRSLIWKLGLSFIANNPFFGNGSYLYRVEIQEVNHLHNSFLQLIADNGLPIAGLFFLWVIPKIKRSNYYIALPLLVYSSFQYGLFWSFSLMDVFFYMALFSPLVNQEVNEVETASSIRTD